jgi:hypothetical protein
MSVTIRGDADANTGAIADALRKYASAHPNAQVDVYRYSPVSVRARVIDQDFHGQSRSERHRTVWPLLSSLDEEILGDLTLLILLTPEERERSIASLDFDNGSYARDYDSAMQKASQRNGTTSR